MEDAWIQTFTGGKHLILDPGRSEMKIIDIAHALSNICRFGGHARRFYSVAQHCVIVSEIVPSPHKLWGLLHDAPEAYLGDVMSPVKRLLSESVYPCLEERTEIALANQYGLTWPIPDDVRHADSVALATEARDIMGGQRAGKWSVIVEPMKRVISPWAPEEARTKYLERALQISTDGRRTP